MRRDLCLILVLGPALGAPAAPAGDKLSLEKDILPLLRQRCGECHEPEKRKGRLDLTAPEGIARGGKKGLAVVPARPPESLLWLRVSRGEMPPEAPLAESERALLFRWIEEGAAGLPDARALPPPPPEGAGHWAFRPPERPPVPEVRGAARARNDIDRFIQAALETRGLTLAPEAGRAALIRRVSFDLTGLPPSPAEIALFLADPAPDAYERMVERYLASPHHGERWGRHWLDAAGYADSNGHFHADSERPHAWRYRDWVVRAVNADLPYDRFIQEQIAGDEIAGFRPDMDILPETADLITATHYLRNAQDGTGESDGNDLEQFADKVAVLDGTVQIVASSLLGLTVQCARCHDHKFDPLSQVEYYRLQAVFAAAYAPERWRKPAQRVLEAGTRAEREERRKLREGVEGEIKTLQSSLEAFAAPLKREAVEERIAALPEPERSSLRKARETPKEKRSEEEKALLQRHEGLLEVKEEELAKRFPDFAGVKTAIQGSIEEKRRGLPPPLPQIAALFETEREAPPWRLLRAGSPAAPGEAVEPGVPAVLAAAGEPYRIEPPPAGGSGSGRRLALARWIASSRNPLFARVAVNRIWQHHFGAGIVSTPENFGRTGSPPSHPELLDWLAVEFQRRGFGVKALHRLVLGSATYRQSSAALTEAEAADPENRLLSRFRPRRLDAEPLRDALLAASGELDRTIGGPPTPTSRGDDGQVVVDENAGGAYRRSLYLRQRRTEPVSLLEAFDAPLVVTSCTRRSVSTTPLQSLALLNSDFVLRRARAFAARVLREAGADRETRLGLAFLLALGRSPGPEERAAAERFLDSQAGEYAGKPGPEELAWADLCQSILASNAFLYVD